MITHAYSPFRSSQLLSLLLWFLSLDLIRNEIMNSNEVMKSNEVLKIY